MSCICIGPVCIPYSGVYAILMFIVKIVYDQWRKMTGQGDKLAAAKKNATLRSRGEQSTKRSKLRRDDDTKAVARSGDDADEEPRVSPVTCPEEWEELVSSARPVVVQFTAAWCKPCKKVKPFFFKLSTLYPECDFALVDVDEEELFEVTQNYATAIPTFLVLKDGKPFDQFTGADEEKLERMVSASI